MLNDMKMVQREGYSTIHQGQVITNVLMLTISHYHRGRGREVIVIFKAQQLDIINWTGGGREKNRFREVIHGTELLWNTWPMPCIVVSGTGFLFRITWPRNCSAALALSQISCTLGTFPTNSEKCPVPNLCALSKLHKERAWEMRQYCGEKWPSWESCPEDAEAWPALKHRAWAFPRQEVSALLSEADDRDMHINEPAG